jgi:hypothetical protein
MKHTCTMPKIIFTNTDTQTYINTNTYTRTHMAYYAYIHTYVHTILLYIYIYIYVYIYILNNNDHMARVHETYADIICLSVHKYPERASTAASTRRLHSLARQKNMTQQCTKRKRRGMKGLVLCCRGIASFWLCICYRIRHL